MHASTGDLRNEVRTSVDSYRRSSRGTAEPSTSRSPTTLTTGARILDGVGPALIKGRDVLVEDGKIAAVGPGLSAPEGANVIDAAGRVMTPGSIDVHYPI